MPWLLYICIFFSDFLCFDMILLLLTVTLRGVSNKQCLLPLFSFDTGSLCYRHIVDVHEGVKCQKVFLTNLQHFELSQFLSNAHI